MKTLPIATFLNVDIHVGLASTWRRYFAFTIDWVFKGTYIFFILYLAPDRQLADNYLVSFFLFTPVYFYTLISEWLLKGQTLGKKIMKIKVVNTEGNPPSVGQCAVRWMFLFVDAYATFLLNFVSSWLMALAPFGPFVAIIKIERSPYKQRFGDTAAGTYVVDAEEDHYEINDTVYAYAAASTNYKVMYPEVLQLSDKDMTIVKNLLEKSEEHMDDELAQKLADRVKEIINIESKQPNRPFLRKLLNDYNHLSRM